MYSKRTRSEAAKLGWERRRARARAQAEYEAALPAAQARLAEARAQGLTAVLAGLTVCVSDDKAAEGHWYMTDYDSWRIF